MKSHTYSRTQPPIALMDSQPIRGRSPSQSGRRTPRNKRLIPLFGILMLLGACTEETIGSDATDIAISQSAVTAIADDVITIDVPSGISLENVPILARQKVRLNDRVVVTDESGTPTTVVNTGWWETNIGVDAVVDNVVSRAPVTLRDRARANGKVTSARWVQAMNGVTVTGGINRFTPIPLETVSWRLPRRTTSRGGIHLEPDQSLKLDAGTYGDVHIKSRSTLFLEAGDYLFDEFTLEPQSKLVLNDSGGLVTIRVKRFTFRGEVVTESGQHPDLLIVSEGTDQVVVDAPFQGSIIAPNEKVNLISTDKGHEGTFYGREIEVQPGTTIRHKALDWDEVINGPTEIDISWTDGSAILRAAEPAEPEGHTDGHVVLDELISFKIPKRLRVLRGNAGNHSAVFTFRTQQNNIVTCNYQGGSALAEPEGGIELAKGLYYELMGCSNGSQAESTALGSEFWLTIDGVQNPHGGYNLVEVHLNGCGGRMEPPFEPEESVRLVEEFSWADTSPVPEYDTDGFPKLYYANIYIEDGEQLGALDDTYIHYDPMPIFRTELERFDGQCGAVDASGDGEGIFVFAILPGVTYNLLREYALSPYIDPETGEDQTVFDVVILRDPPAAAANPDGSIAFDALADSSFLYMNMTDLPDETDEIQQSRRKGRFRKWIRKAAKKIGKIVREVTRGVVTTLGAIHLALVKDANLYINLSVENRDPRFTGEMWQAWGANAGNPAKPAGMKIDIKMWSTKVLPTLFSSTANENGVAHIKVPKGSGDRGKNPICMHLDNRASSVTMLWLYDRVCDFGNGTNIPTNNSSAQINVSSNHKRIHLHNVLTDAFRYFKTVSDYEPRKANVLTGIIANVVGAGFAPCQGLQSSTGVLEQVSQLFNIIPFTVSEADIMIPVGHAWGRNNRSLAVHEYGHFAMCNLLYDEDPNILEAFLIKRFTSPIIVSSDDDESILYELLADYTASQVTGAVGYFQPDDYIEGNSMYYCRDFTGRTSACLEENGTPVSGSGGIEYGSSGATEPAAIELARRLTTLHDGFDGHYLNNQSRLMNTPNGADLYSWDPTTDLLSHSSLGWAFLDPQYVDDENIHLPGEALKDWFDKWDWVFLNDFHIESAMTTLAETMYDHENNWCDVCDLFVLHEANVGSTHQDHWTACSQGQLGEIVGPAPDSLLNMEAATCEPCDPKWFSDGNGNCTACGLGEIAIQWGCEGCEGNQIASAMQNACIDCPPHAIANDTHSGCIPCGPEQIVENGACEDCPDGWAPAPDGNYCVECPPGQVSSGGSCHDCPIGTMPDPDNGICVGCEADEIIPFNNYAAECNWGTTRSIVSGGGYCGDYHKYIVSGLQAVPIDQDLTIQVDNPTLNQAECEATTGDLKIRPPASMEVSYNNFTPIFTAQGCDLQVSKDIRDWVDALGADWMQLEITTNQPVTLSVRSGPTCPIY